MFDFETGADLVVRTSFKTVREGVIFTWEFFMRKTCDNLKLYLQSLRHVRFSSNTTLYTVPNTEPKMVYHIIYDRPYI